MKITARVDASGLLSRSDAARLISVYLEAVAREIETEPIPPAPGEATPTVRARAAIDRLAARGLLSL